MPTLNEKLQQMVARALAIPSTDKSMKQVEAEIRSLGADLEKDIQMVGFLGLIGSAEDMAQQVRKLAESWMGPPPAAPVLAPPDEFQNACRVLRIYPSANLKEAEAAYRERVKLDHPDRGGSAEDFERDNAAIKTLREHWRTRP